MDGRQVDRDVEKLHHRGQHRGDGEEDDLGEKIPVGHVPLMVFPLEQLGKHETNYRPLRSIDKQNAL